MRPRDSQPLALGRPASWATSATEAGVRVAGDLGCTGDAILTDRSPEAGQSPAGTLAGASSGRAIEMMTSSGSEVPVESLLDSSDREVCSEGVIIPGTPNSAVPEVEFDITP